MLPNLSGLGSAPTGVTKEARVEGQGDMAEKVFSNLDLVAVLLSKVEFKDERKADACRAAMRACNPFGGETADTTLKSVNKTFRSVCERSLPLWRDWSAAVFSCPDADAWQRLLGEGLIYRTFYVDADPIQSFGNMCRKSAVADVTSKLFVLNMCDSLLKRWSDRWFDSGYDESGLDGAGWAALTPAQLDAMGRTKYPIGLVENVSERVAAELKTSMLKSVFDEEATRSPLFRAMFDFVFDQVIAFYTDHRGGDYPYDEHHFQKKLTTLGDMLGEYIVCVAELQKRDWAARQVPIPDDREEMTEQAFLDHVLLFLETAHADAPEIELRNLFSMARKNDLLVDRDRYVWNVNASGEWIYMLDLQRRIAVAVDYLVNFVGWGTTPGARLTLQAVEVYSKGLSGEDDWEIYNDLNEYDSFSDLAVLLEDGTVVVRAVDDLTMKWVKHHVSDEGGEG